MLNVLNGHDDEGKASGGNSTPKRTSKVRFSEPFLQFIFETTEEGEFSGEVCEWECTLWAKSKLKGEISLFINHACWESRQKTRNRFVSICIHNK